ncbi:MAG TPA: RNA polymerase sigma factor SigZ [Phototrophicaceae bacterium]|jgi:RNA polymerase sigma-70 factor (ECF subfamily)|nr:RNA polymerase sigma factor SigZ [Phototrophicaceae bacterium]
MNNVVETVWNTLNPCLIRFIRRRVPDEQIADDLLQEVYLKIYTHITSLRDDRRLEAWVFQIARNAIIDYYRTRKPVDELDELSETIAAPDTVDIDDEIDEPDDLSARLSEGVQKTIESLPEEYRQALILTEYEGLTQQELADRLGLSLSGAKSRVQRGRKLMRELMLACSYFKVDRLGKVVDYRPCCDC